MARAHKRRDCAAFVEQGGVVMGVVGFVPGQVVARGRERTPIPSRAPRAGKPPS